MDTDLSKGSFTLPGEAGYEDLTLALAKKWGADVIRDSDGTVLSDSIVSAGFDIYSTVCLVRSDNEWAKAHPDKLQQNFLMSFPVAAQGSSLKIDIMKGYFREQFRINMHEDPKEWWQVFDRTSGEEVPRADWSYDAKTGKVSIKRTKPWHEYTVNFLAYTIWEAISMYNHVTNDWGGREHLMVIDPIYPEARSQILAFLKKWLGEHPRTKVVRLTSMFYNFAWFWGDSPSLRYVYSDWGGYDHTVSPLSLREFEKAKGYRLSSEDFVNGGAYCSSHNVPSKKYLDWIDFMCGFVSSFGRECIDLIHAAGKQAYMFYDDHWIGTEPYGKRFGDFGFDGLIKCCFNGFEVRLCSGAKGVRTKELRLHPYLFPTGLKGEPTFKEGGSPKADCARFWTDIRRALLRAPIDRIGLGGYLHLVEGYPDFVDYVEKIAREFRSIKGIIRRERPLSAPFKVGVLSSWGSLRSWICCGHFNRGLELNELYESLAGLPFEVEFLSFEDLLEKGIPSDVGVLVNAGKANSSWTGGERWADPRIVEKVAEWVGAGHGFLGVGEPSAHSGGDRYFRLSSVLGVDREVGRFLSKDKRKFTRSKSHFILPAGNRRKIDFGKDVEGVFVTEPSTRVLAEKEGSPKIAVKAFGRGRSVYLSGFAYSAWNTRLLHKALYWAAGREAEFGAWTCDNIRMECAYYPSQAKLIVINNSGEDQEASIAGIGGKQASVKLEPFGMKVLDI